MGKVIMCIGKQAKTPYVFHSVGMAVSSMEELCHLLYHKAYVMQDELFDAGLLTFIGEELGLSGRAEYLRRLCENHAGAKDIIVAIFCSTDYYEEQEIKKFLKDYDAFFEMRPIQRKKWGADQMLLEGRETEAGRLYKEILDSGELAVFTETEHGNMLHNLAVFEMRAGLFRSAPQHFKEAYRLNQSDESLGQYLMALKLIGQDQLLDQELKELSPRREVVDKITQELYLAGMAAEQTPDFQELLRLRELNGKGKIAEYYQGADALLEKLKSDYRKSARRLAGEEKIKGVAG